jgi:cyclopropane fatty-acyl-phospholipid synthase-like methyltransferase
MRSVLHDWSTEASISILKAVHATMEPTAKLLLVDIVFDEPHDTDPVKRRSDTLMQIIGGKERSQSEFKSMLSEAGFELVRIVHTRSHHSVIEARRM